MSALLVVSAYLLGSVSFALIAARRRGIDLRSVGSGNLGATNVARALGSKTGRIVMLLDGLKGFLPTAIAHWAIPQDWPTIVAAGWAATIGHCFPIWHSFAGGKGAATSAGVLLGAIPGVGALAACTFILTKKLSRRASVASLSAASLAAVAAFFLYGNSWPTYLACGLWLLIVIRHTDNIGRLLRGEEPPSQNDSGV